jgi:hypothetical protein
MFDWEKTGAFLPNLGSVKPPGGVYQVVRVRARLVRISSLDLNPGGVHKIKTSGPYAWGRGRESGTLTQVFRLGKSPVSFRGGLYFVCTSLIKASCNCFLVTWRDAWRPGWRAWCPGCTRAGARCFSRG